MHSQSSTRVGRIALGVALSVFALAACSQKPTEEAETPAASEPAATATAPEAAANTAVAAPAAGAVTPDSVDTLSGAKFASFTGDAAKGEKAFIACKVCHAPDKNMIGPMLKGIVGRAAGTVEGYTYSTANKNSGITWSPEKLFQYLEKPQRVVPGTKMTYPGMNDPQQRADTIAYLATLK